MQALFGEMSWVSVFGSIWEEFLLGNRLSKLIMEELLFSVCTLVTHFIEIKNLVPLPSSLSILTQPPIYSIKSLQIESPKPTPWGFCFQCLLILLKLTKRVLILSFGIPIPVSSMTISKLTKHNSVALSLFYSSLAECDSFRIFWK